MPPVAAVATTGFGDDGEATRVIKIIDDDEANLEDTDTSGATAEEAEVRITYMHAFNPKQDTDADYNIIKEFPGEIQVFIDDMDRYVFHVAVEDRDMSKILDTDGNAYIGFTASTGSRASRRLATIRRRCTRRTISSRGTTATTPDACPTNKAPGRARRRLRLYTPR